MSSVDLSKTASARGIEFTGILESPVLFVILLGAGFIARAALMAFTTASTDLEIYGHVAYDGTVGVPLYQNFMFSYPMLWGYVFRIVGLVCHLLGTGIFGDFPMLAPYSFPGLYTSVYTYPLATALFKLPAVIADAGTAYLIGSFVRQYGGSLAQRRAAMLLWWLNPLVIWVGSVQAGWDSFVAFTIVASIILASRRNWFGSGAMLALGVCAKLVPVFVAVPVGLYIVRNARGAKRIIFSTALACAGAIIVAALAMWPILVWNEVSALKFAVFARVGQFLIQGLNLGQIAWVRQFTWIFGWEEYHRNAIVVILSRAQMALIAASLLLGLLIRRYTALIATLHAVTLYLIVFVLSPYIQPNYFLWILPLLAILGVSYDRKYFSFALVMSVVTFVFIVVVRAWQATVLPACIFLHVCDPVAFSSAALKYTALVPGLFSMSRQVDVDSVVGEIGGIVFIAMLVFSFLRLIREARDCRGQEFRAENPPTRLSAHYGSIGAALLATFVLVILQFAVPPRPTLAALSPARSGAEKFQVQNYIGSVTVLNNPLKLTAIDDVYLYDDDAYLRGRGGSRAFASSFRVHFDDEIARRGTHALLHVVDAQQLRSVLLGKTGGRAVLILEGFLPDIVRNRKYDLMKNWIMRGGVAMWAGAPFDAFYSTRFGKSPAHLIGPDYEPWNSLYNGSNPVFVKVDDPWSPPLGLATHLAPLWGINRINFSRTTFPAREQGLRAYSGAALGYIDDQGYSSISQIPVGRGALVFFGDAAWNEIDAAHAVVQILYTGSFFDPRRIGISNFMITPDSNVFSIKTGNAPSLRVYGVPPTFFNFTAVR